MKTIAIIMCSFVLTSRSYDHKRCDKNGTLFYESLSCTPNVSEFSECPESFTCDSMDRKADGCLLKGKHYNIEETVEDNLQLASCKADCSCRKIGEIAEFRCATVDCPEYEDGDDSNCYYGYELGQCCSVRSICPPFSDVACKVADKIFKEGEQFYGPDSCTECICEEGFEGKYVEPFCKRMACLVQLDNAEMLAKRCAPVYFVRRDGLLCCPTTFVCPSLETFNIVTGAQIHKDGLSCTFGNKTVALGTSLNTPVESLGANKVASCKCEVPPYLTCRVNI